jgi:hypothetical protein
MNGLASYSATHEALLGLPLSPALQMQKEGRRGEMCISFSPSSPRPAHDPSHIHSRHPSPSPQLPTGLAPVLRGFSRQLGRDNVASTHGTERTLVPCLLGRARNIRVA